MHKKIRMKIVCACCHESFIPEWSEEDALKEKKQNFGEMPLDEMALVCTKCFTKIMEQAVKDDLHKTFYTIGPQ